MDGKGLSSNHRHDPPKAGQPQPRWPTQGDTEMRKTDEYGIPESAEYIEELDTLACQLEQKSGGTSQLSREEQVILDVYDAIGHIEGDGLLPFWDANNDVDQIQESFRMLGANEVAAIINETKWLKDVIARGEDPGGYYRITEAEEERLGESEESIYEHFIGIPTRLLRFAKENGISD